MAPRFLPPRTDLLDLASWVVVVGYDVALCWGTASIKPLAYLLLGLYTGVGLHPIAGHVISEHCMMEGDGQVRFGGGAGWLLGN